MGAAQTMPIWVEVIGASGVVAVQDIVAAAAVVAP